jgi:hypothetical protein
VTSEHNATFDHKNRRPVGDVLRAWCAADATDRLDELVEVRKEAKSGLGGDQRPCVPLADCRGRAAAARAGITVEMPGIDSDPNGRGTEAVSLVVR